MKLEISKIEKAWTQSKQDKIQEETKQIQVPIKDNQCKDKKTNWRVIVSLFLFFALCILSYCLYESYEKIDSLYWQRNNSENTVYEVNAELQAKEQEISTLQNELFLISEEGFGIHSIEFANLDFYGNTTGYGHQGKQIGRAHV